MELKLRGGGAHMDNQMVSRTQSVATLQSSSSEETS